MKKLLIILIFYPLVSISQNWTQVANFSFSGRHHPITFANDNFGFVVAGSYLNDVYKYDKLNDVWVQLQNFPASGRGYSYGVTVGDKAYMGLGSNSSGLYPTDWWEYDMNNDLWLQKASLPTFGRNHPAMIAIGNKIYVGCGSNDNGNLDDWWEYDTSNDLWSQKTDFPGNSRHHPFFFSINNYAYVGFGHGSYPGPGSNPSSSSYIYNDFYRYNPNNDTWMQLSNFPSEARVAGTQFSYNSKGYVLSGDGDNHGPLDSGEFWEYSPTNDLWNQLSSHPGDAIWAPGSFIIDCDVYFLLGQNNNSNIPILPTSVYKYNLNDSCGCIDSTAYNFSSLATLDDGSCCYIAGCTSYLAVNYDSLACYDDGSCIPALLGCQNPTASNYDPLANVSSFFGGAKDNNIGSGSYFAGNQHLVFDANKECIIKSAVVYAQSSNTITFEVRDNSGTIINDTTLLVIPGKQRLNLGFDVPVGNDMQLGIASNNSNLYRNNSNVSYPYDIASAINITKSSASSNPYGYYYFFYDIEVESKCLDVSSIDENTNHDKRYLIKIIDLLGRETKAKNNQPLFYIYDDGTVKKQITIE
ncbi:MAG: hypothetical protein VX347_03720 [Bacteroidota bacterium]|nr:hypothetical protein [Bacteroidota bacterium]